MDTIGYEGMEALGKALGSSVRIEALRMLSTRGEMSAGGLAEAVGVTGGAMTAHIRVLAQAGLIEVSNVNGKHGLRKMLSLARPQLLLNFAAPQQHARQSEGYSVEIPVGAYAHCKVRPTCGLATADGFIGQLDDPRYFEDPQRYRAGVLWLMEGEITYTIPNYLRRGRALRSISITQEIASEAPGHCDDWPSRIAFHLNGLCVGTWVSPGDYGARRGVFAPDWWHDQMNQYGLRKTLMVTAAGTFMDGERISSVTLSDIPIEDGKPIAYTLRVSAGERAGGLTLFGEGFGNYSRHLQVTVDA